ncbi:SAM-dependent methyltransferase [Bradyrhizobium sp. SYSU BS000235]|uniref:SAM-dependent methyltransferase n=1 Tax=Bradyrhizobium sp. SYSU BS000235 TaxID=3411332 RepID=UPI003C782F2B
MNIVSTLLLAVVIIIALFVAYNALHYVLFLLVTRPKDASEIGHELNPFEQAQLIEWTPKPDDFLKHDDETRTYDDVFGTYRDEQANYSTCIFPRLAFSRPYEAEYVLLNLRDGMRVLDLGCGSGAAAYYLASRCNIEIVCVTNSPVQADICRRKFAKLGGRGQVIVTDFDSLDLPSESFDAIYSLESIGYTKDMDAWLERCWRMLKPGGSLLIQTPGALDHCRRKEDYHSVTVFFDNWRYNFVGANVLVYKLRRLGFGPIRYRRLPFWAWGLTWNFLQHLVLWKYRLKMRTFVELERIIWRSSKVFIFTNPYSTVLATKLETASCPQRVVASSDAQSSEALSHVAEAGD